MSLLRLPILALALVLPSVAMAGGIPIHPMQCYPAPTNGALRVGPEKVPSIAPEAMLEQVFLRFPAATDPSTAYCPFPIPHDIPQSKLCTAANEPWACCAGLGDGADCAAEWTLDLMHGSADAEADATADFTAQLCAWRADPYQPVCGASTPIGGLFSPQSSVDTESTSVPLGHDAWLALAGYPSIGMLILEREALDPNDVAANRDVVVPGMYLRYLPDND